MPNLSPGKTVWDALILGGGAAGLMCSIVAGQRGLKVAVLEHQERVGKKILISGGGRCNFTNLHTQARNYISQRPDFCRSALARYQPGQFIDLVEKHGMAYHEKKLGQLFCDSSSKDIVELLVQEAKQAGVELLTGCPVRTVTRCEDPGLGGGARFIVHTAGEDFLARSVVVATGGLSFPKLGASGIGYEIAKSFGLELTEIRPGLVPLVFGTSTRFKQADWAELSGVSLPVTMSAGGHSFEENLLFTHRGLSGPAVLQVSSYAKRGERIMTNLLPENPEWESNLAPARVTGGLSIEQLLGRSLPSRFIQVWARQVCAGDPSLAASFKKPWVQLSKELRERWLRNLHEWTWDFTDTEGYAKAEVTVGGLETGELSSKTMEARRVLGLYFVGEVVDVTGWLGGYNFQWAWASGHAAGSALIK